MRILMVLARGFVKPTMFRAVRADNMRAMAAKRGADRARDLSSAQAESVRRALRPYVTRCSGRVSGLARLMGVDQSGFSRFLRGEQGTSWSVAARAAALLGRRVDELLEITPDDLDFPSIKDELARAAARLALLDGVPRAQIESRYHDAPMAALSGMNLDDWHRKLSGGLEHEKLAPAKPRLPRRA